MHTASNPCQTKLVHEYDGEAGAAVTKTGLSQLTGHTYRQQCLLEQLNSFMTLGTHVFTCPCLTCAPELYRSTLKLYSKTSYHESTIRGQWQMHKGVFCSLFGEMQAGVRGNNTSPNDTTPAVLELQL